MADGRSRNPQGNDKAERFQRTLLLITTALCIKHVTAKHTRRERQLDLKEAYDIVRKNAGKATSNSAIR